MFKNKEEFKKEFAERLEELYGQDVQSSHITERYNVLGTMVRDFANVSWRRTKEKVLKVKTLEIKKENDTFKKRLNRVSSPLSRKRLETMYSQNKKYSQNCKRVKTNSEVLNREKKILDRLPRLYLRKGKMVSY